MFGQVKNSIRFFLYSYSGGPGAGGRGPESLKYIYTPHKNNVSA